LNHIVLQLQIIEKTFASRKRLCEPNRAGAENPLNEGDDLISNLFTEEWQGFDRQRAGIPTSCP
jgi:hypothetical protein